MALRLAYRLMWVTLVVALVGCGRAAEEALPPVEPTAEIVAGPGDGGPPDVDNDAPAGQCEDCLLYTSSQRESLSRWRTSSSN